VSWNGHHLVGTLVALLVGMGIVGAWVPLGEGWVNVMAHAPAPMNAPPTDPAAGNNPNPSPAPGTTTKATLVRSSCEKLQEAILNGSEADIVAGMKDVIADRTVDETSRKVAGHYTFRDKGNESKQKKNLLILQDSCRS